MAATKKDEAPMSLDEYQAAQDAEWSQYVATERIYIGGALAFLPGHKVPAGHVTNKIVAKDQVTTTSTTEKES